MWCWSSARGYSQVIASKIKRSGTRGVNRRAHYTRDSCPCPPSNGVAHGDQVEPMRYWGHSPNGSAEVDRIAVRKPIQVYPPATPIVMIASSI